MIMIGTLNKYFKDVVGVAYKDPNGVVYLNDEKIALNNSVPNGYIYLSGEIDFETENGCIGEHTTRRPLVFVGAYPQGRTEPVFNAAIAALSESNIEIETASIDKTLICKIENIDASKFGDVALIRVSFIIEQLEIYDRNCDFDLCKC